MVTAGAFFADAAALPLAPLERIVGDRGIVVVAPHPDDETLGCGGLIALAHADGRAIKIIVLTDGCGSHPNSRTHPPCKLRALREHETLSAVVALGLDATAVSFLRLPDRALPSEGSEADSAAREIAATVEKIRASAILTTWRHDPHCDHQAAWRIALTARQSLTDDMALIAYPIWGSTLLPQTQLPAKPRGWRLPIDGVLSRKERAIRAHCSQISRLVENDPPVLVLTEETLNRFREPYEIYLEAEN
jgi:LmbE family N-acetylglucosaminyl deacetylase